MKVLVAAGAAREGDFAGAILGELVHPSITCDRDADVEGGDGSCGCGRLFTGLASRRYCTRARVVELDMDLDTLASLAYDSLHGAGWDVMASDAVDCATEIAEMAAEHDAGTYVRRWLDETTGE